MTKIWTIIKSRFKKNKQEDWVKKRREICLGCEFNSINTQRTTFTHDFLATLSYFFSWLLKRAVEDHKYGSCIICHCPITLKIEETDPEYTCKHPEGNQWKSMKKELN